MAPYISPRDTPLGDGTKDASMRISVAEAKARLNDLVRRAEAGEDVVLTLYDQPAVRLVPVRNENARKRRAVLEALRKSGAAKALAGATAARSQDFLYD